MASNNESELQAWVDERMRVLLPEGAPEREWSPDTGRGLSQLRKRVLTGRGGKWNWAPTWVWSFAAIGAVAIVVLMLAAPSPRVLAQRCVDCSIALWHGLSATSAPAPPANLLPDIARKPAIDFALEDTKGEMVRLSSYKGRVVLLNFWATWCGGCKTEMPWFVELQDQFRERGLSAIGVSLDEDGYRSVKPYLAKHPVNYIIVAGPEELGRKYHVEAMPVTMLIDRSGRIAVRHVGLVTKAQYQTEIEALLGERAVDSE